MSPFEAASHYLAQQTRGTHYCVAYSAGMDSHVLLHLMTRLRDEWVRAERWGRLRALHIDHGLHRDSAAWADHARATCQQLNVPLELRYVEVSGGDGPEASARKARYGVFADVLEQGEHLLLAQHAEDQAETFLLQALRGSGPDGLGGIPRKRRFASGILARPLLNCSQESLHRYAQRHALQWIDDPSNLDHRYDRNFLRHQIMPLLKTRWPAVSETLGRAALRSAAASQSLLVMAEQDLQELKHPGTTALSIRAIAALPRERAFAALRLYIRERGLRMPRLQDLVQVMQNLVHARADSAGIVNVRDYVIRRYRDQLHVLPPPARQSPFRYRWASPFEPLTIGETGLTLTRELCEAQGLILPEQGEIIVKSRAGGELIKLGRPGYHKAVKKLLQESSVPPWVRDSIPLLYVEDKLAAVWNLAVSVDCDRAQLADNPTAADRPVKQHKITATVTSTK